VLRRHGHRLEALRITPVVQKASAKASCGADRGLPLGRSAPPRHTISGRPGASGY